MNNINLNILNQYSEKGLIYKQVHPTLPLIIWNYTPKTQYENLWHEITIQCRGLITNNEGTIVARPFKKFFNLEENRHRPTSDFEVFEKIDGSCIICFWYKNQWMIATRGSFTSDQAIKGKEMLDKLNMDKIPKNLTYLFEILYPQNMIVVNYGDVEKLVLLGAIEVGSGIEISRHTLEYFAQEIGSDITRSYDGIKDFNTLKSLIKDNEEGFVVRFSNGDRMKIKGQEYLRLHKIMTNVSTTSVWEILSTGNNIEDILLEVPDEFYDKIKDYVKSLRYSFMYVMEDAGKRYDNYYENRDYDVPPKKDYALWVQTQPKHLQAILFKMFDGGDYSSYIWKLIKPEFKKL